MLSSHKHHLTMLINQMDKRNKKNKKTAKSESTNSSNENYSEFENSLTAINNDSILLYNSIQLAWYDYQKRLSSVPCLDLLPILANPQPDNLSK